jgi:hypothetical protein
VDGLTKRQKNHAVDGLGNFRFGIAEIGYLDIEKLAQDVVQ